MKSLFWRVFLICWITNSLVIVAVVAVFAWTQRVPPGVGGADGPRWHYRVLHRMADILREGGDAESLRRYLEGPRRRGGTRRRGASPDSPRLQTLVIDESGKELLGRPADEEAVRIARNSLEETRDYRFAVEDYLGEVVSTPQGRRYAILLRHDHRLLSALWRRKPILVARIVEVILAAGLAAFVLARYVTRPIQRLREATQHLASGELSTRVGAPVARRRDVIGELGRDFDEMAGKMEALLLSQRRLLRDVAHELRSPLARLHVAHGLASRRASDDSRAGLDRIETEIGRLTDLIDQLLSLESLEAMPHKNGWEYLNLAELLEELAEDARFEARERSVDVVLNVTGEPIIHGHLALVRSAMENVMRNAIRYTPEGTSIDVTLTTQQHTAELAVRDRGPGVPDAELDSIFEPFYRTAAARDRGSGGTGLGLAIARRIMIAHHGSITASPAPEGGLLMVLSFPRAHPDSTADASAAPA